MRARIRTATKDRVDDHARGRRVSPSFIAREAIATCRVELDAYRQPVTRLNSTVVEWACDMPEGVRADSLMNWHLDQDPGPKQSPIRINMDDLDAGVKIARYTTPPFSG